STIGVSKVYTEEELKKAIREAFSYDDQILIEKMIEGKEITVGILNGEPLPIIEIAPKSGFYDYRSKYTKGMTEYIIPPNIAPSSYEKASNYAFLTYKRMRLNGCARVDMMMDKKGEPFVLEINSMPGMTSTSLIPKAASYKGISFEDLVEKILNTASLKIKV
ncbi:MAG: D-alanine--D-alanine ligase, partial [Deltaproteobacteria bacterium]|nr:D-alanine--D-alanine ligase [Deltaproteobacteria bacterium]